MDEAPTPRAGSVEFWAARKPDAIVAIEGDRQLTWSELNTAADALAEFLAAAKIALSAVVAVRMQVRLEWLVANAALAKLGATLLGVNTRLVPGELDHLVADSGARALIVDDADPSAFSRLVAAHGLSIALSVEGMSPGFTAWRDAVATAAPPRFSERDTPLIIYTSGTTGKPRGAILGRLASDPPPSREAMEYAASIATAQPKSEDDTILVSMPLSHGSAPAQIRRQIQVGGRIVLARRFVPEEALALIERHGVTSWVVVPTMLNRLAALPDAVLDARDLSSLKSIQVGAAPVSPTIKQWVIGRFGDILHEGYGSTEAGMVSNLTPAMYHAKPASCGKPFAHVSISIRDEAGVSLPTGATGEIWVRTPSIIKGYYGEPPLGSEVLDNDGYFRTGDIGHVDDEDYLFVTGRAKDMIVSGGVNIYPAEVEGALHGHPAVQDVAVIGIPDPEFGEQVKAFVELKPGMHADPEELIRHGKGLLASYKLPRSIDIVEELPRNITGKVMKQDLRERYWMAEERSI